MANSSILGGTPAPAQPSGTDVDALGPSDSSDSGSDVQTNLNHSALPEDGAQGAWPIAHGSTSDASGTGERASAEASSPIDNADLLPDRLISDDDDGATQVDDLIVDDDVQEDEPDSVA